MVRELTGPKRNLRRYFEGQMEKSNRGDKTYINSDKILMELAYNANELDDNLKLTLKYRGELIKKVKIAKVN